MFLGYIGMGFANVRSFVRHEISSWNIWKTIWPRITKFYRHIHTDILYSHTGYDVTIYFRSEAIRENSRKYRLRRLRGDFSRTVQSRIMKFYTLIVAGVPPNLPEMASPAPSGRLQNAVKTCGKRVRMQKKVYNWEVMRDTAKDKLRQLRGRLRISRAKNIGRVRIGYDITITASGRLQIR